MYAAPSPPDVVEDKSFVEIVAPRFVAFRGLGQDVEPAVVAGTVVLHLAESTDLRDITLELTGTRAYAVARRHK